MTGTQLCVSGRGLYSCHKIFPSATRGNLKCTRRQFEDLFATKGILAVDVFD